jgi:hypothetical protein
MASPDDEQDINMDDYLDAVKRGEQSPLPAKVLEDMRKDIVLYVTKDETIDLALDIKSETAYITGDFKHIRLTYANVPRSLRNMPDVVLYLLRGYLLHETGHVFLTKKVEKNWNDFKKKHKQTPLAATVENIIEDARVNHRMPLQFATGENMKDALILHGETWLNGMINNCRKEKAKLDKEGKPWPGTMEDGAVVSLMFLKGLYGKALNGKIDDFLKDWFPNATEEQLEDISLGAQDIELSRLTKVWAGGIEKAAGNLYARAQKYSKPGKIGEGRGKGPTQPGDGSGQGGFGTPSDEEGDGPPVPGQGQTIDKAKVDEKWIPTDYPGGKMEGDIEGPMLDKFKEIQQKEDESREPKEGSKEPGIPGGQGGQKGGGGGAEGIKPNPPNPQDFNMRRSRLLQQINKMKNMLKLQSKPVYEYERFRRSGRLMTPILGKVMGSASRREVSNIYTQTRTRFEKQDATLFLLIDVSGSTDIDMMKDALVLLAEAAGSWIPDENFGIYTFGSYFKKVKEIDEQYENVKYRIGGVDMEGATNILMSLEHLEKTIKGIRKPGTKTLLIVTDFGFGEDDSLIREKIKAIERLNTIVVGICHQSGASSAGDLRKIHEYAKHYGDFALVDMVKVEDLPDNFFEIYKKIAVDGMDKRAWDKARGLINDD